MEERQTNCKDGVDSSEVQQQEAQNSVLDMNNENPDTNTNSEDNASPATITQGTFETIKTILIRLYSHTWLYNSYILYSLKQARKKIQRVIQKSIFPNTIRNAMIVMMKVMEMKRIKGKKVIMVMEMGMGMAKSPRRKRSVSVIEK